MDLSVRKDWADFNNSENLRPESIMLYLFRKTSTAATYPTEPYLTVEMKGYGNQWSLTFFGLVKKDINGIRYDYLVREGDVTGYSPIYESRTENSQIITNVHPTNTPEPGTTPIPLLVPTETPDNLPRIPVGVIEIDGEWYYIDEYGIPLGLVPQTGDETQLILYAGCAMLFIATAVYLFMMLYRRRKNEA